VAFDPALGQAFNFTADELEINRAGRLSDDQEAIRRNSVTVGRRQGGRGARLLFGALVLAGVAAVVMESLTPGDGRAGLLLAGVMLVLIGLLGAVFIRRGSRGVEDIAAADLRTATGSFSWESDMLGRWWGIVGEARFAIDRYQESRLATGAEYTVHYLATGDTAWVMSLERL
jgi:hypothetical protein